jgi:CDP-paratose 2-epimerase
VIVQQMRQPTEKPEPPLNFGGGCENSMSLAQLSDWCSKRFGPHKLSSQPTPRPYDVPWLVMDCQAAAHRLDWRPQRNLHSVLEEIADHAEKNPNWLDLTSA